MHETEIVSLLKTAKKRGYDGSLTASGNLAFDKLWKEYEPDIKKIVAKFYIDGSDRGDIVQEARIGFFKAIDDYKFDGGMSFKNFALNLCIKRHVITCINSAGRKKYEPHKNAVWINTPISNNEGDHEQTLEDFLHDPKQQDILQDILIEEQNAKILEEMNKVLTDMELSIFLKYLENSSLSYKDIAKLTTTNPKAVDNALMRIRKKLKKVYDDYLEGEEFD